MTIATKEFITSTVTIHIDDYEYDVAFEFWYYRYFDDTFEVIEERQMNFFPLANVASYLSPKDYVYIEEDIRDAIRSAR